MLQWGFLQSNSSDRNVHTRKETDMAQKLQVISTSTSESIAWETVSLQEETTLIFSLTKYTCSRWHSIRFLAPKKAKQLRLPSLTKTCNKILVFVLNSDTHHASPLGALFSRNNTHIPWKRLGWFAVHADPCQDPESFLPSSNLKITCRRSCWPSAHLRGNHAENFDLSGLKKKEGTRFFGFFV